MTRDHTRRLAAAGVLAIGLLAATIGPALAGPRDPLLIGPDGFDPFSFPIPASYSYNQVPLGSMPSLTFTVYDLTGAQARITTSVTGSAAFTRFGPSDPYDCARFSILPADQFCNITVQFAPTTLGTVTGQLTVQDSTGDTASVTLSGTGVAHLYWTDVVDGSIAGAGTIMGPLLDGGSPQTLVSGQSAPAGVATDGSHLYWADYGPGTIMEASLDGSNAHSLITGQFTPSGIAVNGSRIYWTEPYYGKVMTANLDGTGVQTLTAGQPLPWGLTTW